MTNFEDLISDYLRGLVGFDASFVFPGAERDGDQVPDRAIFCAAYGGQPPEGEYSSSKSIHRVSVQVKVRGACGDQRDAYELAGDVYAALTYAKPAGAWLVRAKAPPIRLAPDKKMRWKWSVNVTVMAYE